MTSQVETIRGVQRPAGAGPRWVPELFAAQAARTPHGPALIDGPATLTYREAAERVNRLAHHLQRHGVGTETPVGICLPRSADLAVAMLAVLTAGGTFVPLDPDQPAGRLAGMLAGTGAQVAVTAGEIPLPARTVIRLDRAADRAAVARAPASAPAAAIFADGAAYVAHTSGSTGTPKGAVNTHRGLANRVLAAVRTHRIGPEDRVLVSTGVGFDPVIFEIVTPLVAGAAAVLVTWPAGRRPASWSSSAGSTTR